MKIIKTFLLVALTLCIAGCDKPEKDKHGRYVVKLGEYHREIGCLTYFVFDGHEYVRMSDGHQGGICHSPKCNCRR